MQARNAMCVWDDCDQGAIYCAGHAREFVEGEPPVASLEAALREAIAAAEIADVVDWPGMAQRWRAALAKVSA
jgi:hypothetical protein